MLHLNNTYVGENMGAGSGSNLRFLNNLFVAHGGQGADDGFSVTTFTNYSLSDHNAFYFADSITNQFNWNSPPADKVVDYDQPPVSRSFASLADYQRETGQDMHSVMFDPADFVSLTMPDDPDKTKRSCQSKRT